MAVINRKGFISGRAGNMVYRTRGDVQVMQSIPGKMRQTMATKARGKEFGLASSTAGTIRYLCSSAAHWPDKRMSSRLVQTVLKSIRGGAQGEPGLRDLHVADLSILEGFQFNLNSPLEKVMLIQPTVTLGDSGTVYVNIPALYKYELKFAKDASQCILRFIVVAIDLKKETHRYLGNKDILLEPGESLDALIWEVENKAEQGTILLVSFSVHYFSPDKIDSLGLSLNNSALSPGGIIAARHIGDDGAPVTASADIGDLPPYRGNDIMDDFARMLEKAKKK